MEANAKKPKKTSTLLKDLFSEPNLEKFIAENSRDFLALPFHEYAMGICSEKGMIAEQAILRSGIERTYGHQLLNGTRKPSREKVIQLAFGLKLDVEETQKLLRVAQKSALYPKIKRDAAILFCISKQKDFYETQNLLQSLNLSLLGTNPDHD